MVPRLRTRAVSPATDAVLGPAEDPAVVRAAENAC